MVGIIGLSILKTHVCMPRYDGLAPAMVVSSGAEFEVKMPTFASGGACTSFTALHSEGPCYCNMNGCLMEHHCN